MISSKYTVTGTASKIVDADSCWRTVYIHVIGNGIVYLGDSTVTSATGTPTEKGAVPLTLEIPANDTLWAIVATGTEDVRVLRASE